MSALDFDIIEDVSAVTVLLPNNSIVTNNVRQDSEISNVYTDNSLISNQVSVESPLNNEE
jgi:hypothetical protein